MSPVSEKVCLVKQSWKPWQTCNNSVIIVLRSGRLSPLCRNGNMKKRTQNLGRNLSKILRKLSAIRVKNKSITGYLFYCKINTEYKNLIYKDILHSILYTKLLLIFLRSVWLLFFFSWLLTGNFSVVITWVPTILVTHAGCQPFMNLQHWTFYEVH